MKKQLLLGAIFLMALTIMAFRGNTAVQFMAADWDTAKNKAFAEGKLYFVDFDASYCATCRNMDQSTYMSSQLANYIDQNVVALRVDVQDFDGVMWSQQYEVEALPTMLIFDEKGKLVKKIVGYQSASDLIKEFDEAKSETVAVEETKAPVTADVPMTKPDAVVTTNSSTKVNTAPSPYATKTTTDGSFMGTDAAVTKPQGKGLYEMTITKIQSKDYGVQVGVFSNYELVLEQASAFKQKYKQKTIVHVDTHNGSTVYKLILGTFADKNTAFNFRNALRQNGQDGLIKDLKYLG